MTPKEKAPQTAVEWLAIYLKGITSLNCDEVINQAKEMEKEQIIDFAKQCLDKALDLDVRTSYSQIEQYYNDKFKK